MGPVAPVVLPVVDQPEVGFVDEARRAQRMVGPFVPQLGVREAAERVVDLRQQGIEGVPVAVAQVGQQAGHVGVVHGRGGGA